MSLIGRARAAFGEEFCLGDLPVRLREIHGDRVLADCLSGETWSATRLEATTREWSEALATRIKAGDRVVIRLPNGFEYFAACLAVCRAGGIAVPVNDKMTAAEIDHVVSASGATIVVDTVGDLTKRSRKKRAPSGIQTANPNDVAAIFYTSGTTGLPKGAELTHRGLLASTRRLASLPIGWLNDEAVIGLPVAHIMGFTAYLGAALAGLRLFVMERFRALDALEAIEQRKSSVFIGVPTMYRMLDEAGASSRDLSSVRIWMSGADAMPPDLVRKFQKMGAATKLPFVQRRIGEALFVEGYGMVELSGGAAMKVTPPFAGSRFVKPIGIPLPNSELRVVDVSGKQVRIGEIGELQVKSPGVLRRYRNDDLATAATVTADGWLNTGDLAKRQRLGAVEFAGRAKDVIKVGGYSVFCAEVQAVLETISGVAEASVVGLSDEKMGEVVAVALRQKLSEAPIDLAAAKRFAVEKLSSYKVPHHWVVVDDLPRTGTDKVQRNAVRALFANVG
jgi:acyl-CoA synthetase (AMP-forming)/AMP-acid ligase II